MHPVLQRIAIYGTLTAVFLGVIGMMIGNIAIMFVPQSPDGIVNPADGANPDEQLISAIRVRTPIMLAIWGFVFVAVGELLLHAWRRRHPAAPPSATTAEREATEKQIQEMLAQAEADEKASAGVGEQESRRKHRDLGGESMEMGVTHRKPGGESREVDITAEPPPSTEPPKTP